ncbi:hypothetical protein [Prevotella sp. KH2C16]|uniref:hypothetical protein n=1 Tax=Prevotella sp. KH2C16 TaxID=1855325 RepID=UPI0008DF0B41|nr:hypothetical protein [Prevotella sp. KH2C16]SFG35987.1 hypothetical protein SAMN05216383_11133 [Prevotella sp. KH2C16]
MEKSIAQRSLHMLLPLALTALLFAGCGSGKTEKSSASPDLSPLTLMDTAQMRPSLLRELRNYIKKFPAFKAYILAPTYLFDWNGITSNGSNVHNDIFFLQPARYGLFDGSEWSIGELYPSHYFMVDGKVVFVPSRSDAYLAQTPLKEVYDKFANDFKGFSSVKREYLLVVHKRDSVRIISSLYEGNLRTITSPPPALRCIDSTP